MTINLPDVNATYGAPMGRRSFHPDELTETVRLEKVQMSSEGAYDTGGAYWGIGEPLYLARTLDLDNELYWFFRARSRAEAKAKVLEEYPEAKFFR